MSTRAAASIRDEVPGFWETLRRQYATVPFLAGVVGRAVLRKEEGAAVDRARLERIGTLGRGLEDETVEALRARSLRLRDEVRAGREFDTALEEAFALVREMARRVLGLYPYDVQMLGGLALVRGSIAEMATGEGKTLVQLLPAYALGLLGKGVHVATANGYLAQRDEAFGAPVLEALGLTSALLPERVAAPRKRMAYEADVTYGTGSEFGFDYLRDQLALMEGGEPEPGSRFWKAMLGQEERGMALCQRGLFAAIVDEADAILIDEALTPLLISQHREGAGEDGEIYREARRQALALEEGIDYEILPGARQPRLTERGQERVYEAVPAAAPNGLRRPWHLYIDHALRARHGFEQDRQYIVRDGKVVIVDEFTGRIKEGSSWREGLHQAVEAEAGVEITAETEPRASISRQRFFKLYERLCGMTGTGLEAAGEFWGTYRLPVVPIPRHRPSRFIQLPSRIFRTQEGKLAAAVEEIEAMRRLRRPVLVGTRTIATSRAVADLLERRGIPLRLLHAAQDEHEAEVIAKAGQPGAVTIATHMAGRGTHIDLGPGVAEAGGLHVLALEMDESQRIDRQLLGRGGRQGIPGSGRLLLSGEDHLVDDYGSEGASRYFNSLNDENEEGAANAERFVRRLQREAERRAYEQRLATMERDRWFEETKRRVF